MIDHISPSQMRMFQKCPAQWYYRYQMKMVRPPGYFLIRGKSYDAGCQKQFETRLVDERDATMDEVIGAFEESFDKTAPDTDWEEHDPAECKDSTVRCLHAYRPTMLGINPTAVQEKIELEFENAPKMLMFLDVVHEDSIVVDQKTSGKTPSVAKPDDSIQVQNYIIAKTFKSKKKYTGRLDYAVPLAKSTNIHVFNLDFTDAQQEFQMRQIWRVGTAIQYAAEHPETIIPNRTHQLCSPKWCGYWRNCHGDF